MSNEHKTTDDPPADKSAAEGGMTRRKWMLVTAGGLLAASGYATIRRLNEPDRVRISIKGPFKEFGSISLEDLDVPKKAGAFQPIRMKLSDSLRLSDRIHVIFSFKGDEDPSRVITVEAVARDLQGGIVASETETFRDPRIEAKKAQELGIKRDPLANMSLRLAKGVLLSKVGSIDLFVTEDRRKLESKKS